MDSKQFRAQHCDPKKETKAPESKVQKTGSWRTNTAKPETVQGIRFGSKIEAYVYKELELQRAILRREGRVALVFRQVAFDLPALTGEGEKPERWRVDFLAIWEGEDNRLRVEMHEAKGSKVASSRDWPLRAKAWRVTYAMDIDAYVWTYAGRKIVRKPLIEVLS
jgi:hypothetical protein